MAVLPMEFEDTDSSTLTADTAKITMTSGNVRKKGSTCTFYLDCKAATTLSGWNQIATIPVGYRPAAGLTLNQRLMWPNNSTFPASISQDCYIYINDAGQVLLKPLDNSSIAVNTEIKVYFTYVC